VKMEVFENDDACLVIWRVFVSIITVDWGWT